VFVSFVGVGEVVYICLCGVRLHVVCALAPFVYSNCVPSCGLGVLLLTFSGHCVPNDHSLVLFCYSLSLFRYL